MYEIIVRWIIKKILKLMIFEIMDELLNKIIN